MKVLSSDVWPSPECPVQSGGRKREWNLGLALPGALTGPLLTRSDTANNLPTLPPSTHHYQQISSEERESSKVQHN